MSVGARAHARFVHPVSVLRERARTRKSPSSPRRDFLKVWQCMRMPASCVEKRRDRFMESRKRNAVPGVNGGLE